MQNYGSEYKYKELRIDFDRLENKYKELGVKSANMYNILRSLSNSMGIALNPCKQYAKGCKCVDCHYTRVITEYTDFVNKQLG